MADASLFAMTAGQEAPLFNQSEFSLQSGMCKYKCLLLDCFVYSVAGTWHSSRGHCVEDVTSVIIRACGDCHAHP